MARNQVQFQKGLREAGFAEIYGTEEQSHAALLEWRWPNGFECPGCDGADHCVVARGARRLLQCNACRKQTSVKEGTIFASARAVPLRIWFKTIYLVTQSKKGISHGSPLISETICEARNVWLDRALLHEYGRRSGSVVFRVAPMTGTTIEAIRTSYPPQRITTLFVGESAPASGRRAQLLLAPVPSLRSSSAFAASQKIVASTVRSASVVR